MLEQRISELTDAVKTLTEVLKAQPAPTQNVAADDAPVAETAPAGTSSEKPVRITIDTVRDALRDVSKAVSRDAALKVLDDAGYKRVSELPEDDYANFISMCREKIDEASDV